MGLTSVQVCMDSPDWLQGTINEESGMEMDCSSLTGEMLSCSRPLTERRLRPQHEQALKCPRCDSTHTKFCYYNNYSLSQPRYFCKTCRRYWTKGGTLRNIPVGGGCRKNKKVSSSSKKSNDNNNIIVPQSQHIIPLNHQGSSSSTELHLSSFQDQPQLQFPHFNSPNFMDIGMLETSSHSHSHRPFDFMDTKMEGSHQHYPTNAEHLAMMGALPLPLPLPDAGLCSSPYGLSLDGAAIGAGLMIPYEHQQPNEDQNSNSNSMDVKPNAKVLALEWQDSQKMESYGYINGMGSIGMGMGSSWNGMISNGYGHGPSTTNPLV